MAGNSNLHMSKAQKEDEFYTELSMIEKELKFYKQHFENKTVFCNCDDPEWSNFWKYFELKFDDLKLKKLISTHFDATESTYKLELSKDTNNDGVINSKDIIKTPLKENGDFRSPECLSILDECDIVVTNPPFSLFREYITTLIEHDKKFIIIGNLNNITYNEMMPLIKEQKIWAGKNAGHYWFRVPDWYEEKKTDFKIDDNGVKWRRMGNICWFTNMDIPEHYEDLTLYAPYNPDEYPKCLNIDAIFVKLVDKIPIDYDGLMAVPITILPKLNPKQFELVGFDKELTDNHGRVRTLQPNGKEKTEYARLIIRRKL